jgi:triosephosphate isomerase
MTSALRRPLIAGNWKMHRTVDGSVELARAVADTARVGPRTDVVVAPVFTALHAVARALKGTAIGLAAQHCHWEDQGAYTGEIAPPMLKDVGCQWCLVGHSERRQLFHETDVMVHRKTAALRRHGLRPIVCVGETLSERESGVTFDVLRRQWEGALGGLAGDEAREFVGDIALAYEPVWAIGTGRTAKSSDAQAAHAYLRDRIRHDLGEVADGDGLLVGGASLDAPGFARIIQAAG